MQGIKSIHDVMSDPQLSIKEDEDDASVSVSGKSNPETATKVDKTEQS